MPAGSNPNSNTIHTLFFHKLYIRPIPTTFDDMKNSNPQKHLWDSSKTKKEAIDFAAGWDIKHKPKYEDLLIPYQIKLDKAYSVELLGQGYINKRQFNAIQDGLSNLQYKEDRLSVEGYEDVHSFVESRLREQHGKLVGNLHLGLSRNDMICTIMRMLMKNEAENAESGICTFISVLNSEISEKGKLIIPGYTHHRVAMPSTYGLLLDSYTERLARVKKDLTIWKSKYNKCPLGSAAGFGSPLEMNWDRVALELGFDSPIGNSLDAVSTRWEAEADLAFSLSMLLNHLSTISQDFIFMSSAGINVLELPQEYCTGSSIMPQKRNPDVLEAIKAKAAIVHGITFSIMEIGKNISGYNRDTQWTKYLIMDAIAEYEGTTEILRELIKGTKVNEKRSKKLLKQENAFSAEEAIKRAILEKTGFRQIKLEIEKRIKK